MPKFNSILIFHHFQQMQTQILDSLQLQATLTNILPQTFYLLPLCPSLDPLHIYHTLVLTLFNIEPILGNLRKYFWWKGFLFMIPNIWHFSFFYLCYLRFSKWPLILIKIKSFTNFSRMQLKNSLSLRIQGFMLKVSMLDNTTTLLILSLIYFLRILSVR